MGANGEWVPLVSPCPCSKKGGRVGGLEAAPAVGFSGHITRDSGLKDEGFRLCLVTPLEWCHQTGCIQQAA
jgi:hypothetical protein